MRLCVLTTSYPRFEGDDAGIFVQRLVQALAQQGVTGLVIAPRSGQEPPYESSDGFEVLRFSYGILSRGSLAFGEGIMPRIRRNPLLAAQIPLLLLAMTLAAVRRRGQYDVLHANWIGAGIAAWITRAIVGAPYVLTLRGEDMRLLKKPFLRTLLSPVVRSAKAITSVNESFRTEIIDLFGVQTSKVHCIPNGVEIVKPSADELRSFAAAHQLVPDGKYLLFVGTIIPRKKIELLIDLLSYEKLSSYKLILCGRTDEKDYLALVRRRAEEKGVLHRIHFQGMVSPREVPYYLGLSHCFVTAAEHEGRPNALMEAMAAGVPVFASDIPPHRELLRQYPEALFDPGAMNSVAEKIASSQLSRPTVSFPTWAEAATRYAALW